MGMKSQTWTYRGTQIHDFSSFLAIKAMDLLLFQGITNNPARTRAPWPHSPLVETGWTHHWSYSILMFLLYILPYELFQLFIHFSNPCLITDFSIINIKDYPGFFGQCWAIIKVLVLGFLHSCAPFYWQTPFFFASNPSAFPRLEAGGFNAQGTGWPQILKIYISTRKAHYGPRSRNFWLRTEMGKEN